MCTTKIGSMTSDNRQNLAMSWNLYGKPAAADKAGKKTVFRYDAGGNKTAKITGSGQDFTTVYFVRDASGNVLARYEGQEKPDYELYGSSRLGTKFVTAGEPGKLILGLRKYEMSNHLGNVFGRYFRQKSDGKRQFYRRYFLPNRLPALRSSHDRTLGKQPKLSLRF